jgi:predicted DsbA family dithiol-disulfide isomerase
VVPIYWGNGSPKPGEAFLLAEEAGMGDKMKAALFKASFEEHKDIGQLDVLEKIGSAIGMGFDFSVRLRSGEKSKAVQKALDLSKENGVEETPSLIIAGHLLTFPTMTHGDIQNFTQNVITILGSILK